MIDDAVKYALTKDVLLVQAAGNSKRNIDAFDNFPNPEYLLTDSIAPNWITVGASDSSGSAADFSNYGASVVNVFAPGVAILFHGTGRQQIHVLGRNQYGVAVVSGVAALIRSYFPNLHAADVKKIIEQTVTIPPSPTLQPGTQEKVAMNKLCSSGGIVNAFECGQTRF